VIGLREEKGVGKIKSIYTVLLSKFELTRTITETENGLNVTEIVTKNEISASVTTSVLQLCYGLRYGTFKVKFL